MGAYAFDKDVPKTGGNTLGVHGRVDTVDLVRFEKTYARSWQGVGGKSPFGRKHVPDRGSPVLKRADGYSIEIGGPFLRPFNL